MQAFLTAVRFLTVVRWLRSRTPTPEETARSASLFPLVGLLLGVVLVFVNRLLDPYLASEILSVALVTILILITWARELEGLGESWDRLARNERVGNVYDSPLERRGLGGGGVLAIVVVVALKFRAIEVMGETRNLGLLLAPALGRWAMVVLAYGSASANQSAARIMIEQVRGKQLLIATAITIAAVVLCGRSLALWVAFWVSLLTLGTGRFLKRRFGGVNTEDLGAIAEMSEALALVLFASL